MKKRRKKSRLSVSWELRGPRRPGALGTSLCTGRLLKCGSGVLKSGGGVPKSDQRDGCGTRLGALYSGSPSRARNQARAGEGYFRVSMAALRHTFVTNRSSTRSPAFRLPCPTSRTTADGNPAECLLCDPLRKSAGGNLRDELIDLSARSTGEGFHFANTHLYRGV